MRKAWSKFNEFTKIHNPKIKVLVSIYPALAAVLLAFFKDPITRSTSIAGEYMLSLFSSDVEKQYIINWWVTIYWIFLLVWISLYFKSVYNESDTNKKNISENKDTLTEIKGAIHNAPNSKVFPEHMLIFDEIYQNLQFLEYNIQNGSATIDIYQEVFNLVLEKMCSLTQVFAQKNDAVYGANIMCYIHNTPHNLAYIKKLKDDKTSWLHFRQLDVSHVRGVLHVVPKLMFKGNPERNIPSITLPIVIDELGNPLLLPGACTAAMIEEAVVNTTDVDKAKNYDQLDKSIKDQARNFFKQEGKDIKSIVSINIPRKGNHKDMVLKNDMLPILGVLNIDCNMEYMIGKEEEYYPTYFSLLRPIVNLLPYYLENYFKLHADLKDIDNFS